MAQIWATYGEVAALCACTTAAATVEIEKRGWPRRRCSDGVVRVKLPADLAYDFVRIAASRSMAEAMATASEQGLSRLAPPLALPAPTIS
jgi:hypothetical protein